MNCVINIYVLYIVFIKIFIIPKQKICFWYINISISEINNILIVQFMPVILQLSK